MTVDIGVEIPPWAEFDMYGIPTPEGEWDYVADETCVVFGPGWWPFRDALSGAVRGVRVSPNVEFQSWRNEYVLMYPSATGDDKAEAYLRLFVRKQGMGAIVSKRVNVEIDIRNKTATVAKDCPAEVREQAEMKAARLLAFILAARAERRKGAERPTMAADLEDKRQNAGGDDE